MLLHFTGLFMNMRVLICGVLGGFLGAYALSLPLYLVLPNRYTDDWPGSDSELLGLLGYLLSTAVAVFTGYTAARWNWSITSAAGLRNGLLAGLLAAMVAYPLIGAPAAAVASQAPIFQHGARPAATDRDAIYIVCECVVRAAWYPYLMFWGMVAGWGVLGGFGGWFAAWQRGTPWGATPPVVADEGCDTSVAVMVMATWILATIIVAISTLESNCQRSVEKYGFELSYSPRGITGWPMASCFVLLAVSTWFTGRWCVRRRNHPDPGVQRAAKLVQMLTGFLPLGLWLAMLRLQPDIVDDLVFALGLAVWILVHVYWGLRRARTAAEWSQPDAPPPPTFRDRLLLNGGLLGSIIPGITMATGVTQAIALALGIVIYLGAIFPKSEPRVFTPHATIQDIYAVHVWGSLNIAAAWIIAATLHAGVVRWWQSYRKRRGTLPAPEMRALA